VESRGFSLSLRASITSVAINDSGRPIRLIASGDVLAMTESLESFGILIRLIAARPNGRSQ
ncbi:MAG: hypothetical protein K2N54_04275, partial [Helicobacter sp.]|nr:hypothetical protein [Helicobacter sp.]